MKATVAKMFRNSRDAVVAPVLVMGAAALILYLVGLAPGYLQKPDREMQDFGSIEQAQTDLGFRIVIPAYFPSYLQWPPTKVTTQRRPSPMSRVMYSSADRVRFLLVYQIAADGNDLPVPVPLIQTVRTRMPADVSGQAGILIVGRDATERLLNAVYWTTESYHFIMVTTESVQELMTMANSMHSGIP